MMVPGMLPLFCMVEVVTTEPAYWVVVIYGAGVTTITVPETLPLGGMVVVVSGSEPLKIVVTIYPVGFWIITVPGTLPSAGTVVVVALEPIYSVVVTYDGGN